MALWCGIHDRSEGDTKARNSGGISKNAAPAADRRPESGKAATNERKSKERKPGPGSSRPPPPPPPPTLRLSLVPYLVRLALPCLPLSSPAFPNPTPPPFRSLLPPLRSPTPGPPSHSHSSALLLSCAGWTTTDFFYSTTSSALSPEIVFGCFSFVPARQWMPAFHARAKPRRAQQLNPT